jgi:ethanolamine ammonia-lyase small subunit
MIDAGEIARLVAEAVDEYAARQNAGRSGGKPAGTAERSGRRDARVTDRPVPSDRILPPPEIKTGGGIPAAASDGRGVFHNAEALPRMKSLTKARIGVGSAGPRLRTATLLRLRADHAAARDSVFRDVSAELLRDLDFPAYQSRCADRREHITRPDLGRRFSAEAAALLRERGDKGRDVQVIAADGLSSAAIEANLANLWLVLENGLAGKNISMGKPFFVRYGRVALEDEAAEILGAKLVCILIGERPGLAAAESMSAYLCYDAKMGQNESRRTVVSNIHSAGIPAAEAGAYLVDLIGQILEKKASGVEFKGNR